MAFLLVGSARMCLVQERYEEVFLVCVHPKAGITVWHAESRVVVVLRSLVVPLGVSFELSGSQDVPKICCVGSLFRELAIDRQLYDSDDSSFLRRSVRCGLNGGNSSRRCRRLTSRGRWGCLQT